MKQCHSGTDQLDHLDQGVQRLETLARSHGDNNLPQVMDFNDIESNLPRVTSQKVLCFPISDYLNQRNNKSSFSCIKIVKNGHKEHTECTVLYTGISVNVHR